MDNTETIYPIFQCSTQMPLLDQACCIFNSPMSNLYHHHLLQHPLHEPNNPYPQIVLPESISLLVYNQNLVSANTEMLLEGHTFCKNKVVEAEQNQGNKLDMAIITHRRGWLLKRKPQGRLMAQHMKPLLMTSTSHMGVSTGCFTSDAIFVLMDREGSQWWSKHLPIPRELWTIVLS